MTSFDPIGLNEYNEITLISQICGRLTSVDESLNIEGDVAESWVISPDHILYSFVIRKDRHFADGTPVTVDDIKYSIERVTNQKGSVASTWTEDIKRVSITNSNTLAIELRQANPRLLYKLSHPRFCILNQKRPFLDINGVKIPNSTGAYHVEGATKSEVDLGVAKDFEGKAVEKQIEVRFLDQGTAVSEFKKGALDDLSFYLLEDNDIEELRVASRVLRMKIYWSWILALNPHSQNFRDLSRRRLFSHQIDRSAFVETWGADTQKSGSIIPFGMRGYSEAGVPKSGSPGFSTKFSCPIRVIAIEGMPLQKSLVKALEQTIGSATHCSVLVDFLEMGRFMESLPKRAADIYVSGIDTNSTDPLGFYRVFIHGESDNLLGFDDKGLNKTFRRLDDLIPEKRTQSDYEEIQRAFYSAAYGVVIGHPHFKFAYAKGVKAVHMNPLGMPLNRWWKIGRF